MDPITLSIILGLLVMEATSGGFVTANVAGGVAGAATALGRETAKGARARYAKRKARLSATRTGRWRLRAEAATAGAARGVTRGLAAAFKGVKPGAAKGRQVRRQALDAAKAKAATAADTWRAWQNGGHVPDSPPEPQDQDPAAGEKKVATTISKPQAVVHRGTGWKCPECGYPLTGDDTDGWKCPNACVVLKKDQPEPQKPSAPESPERGTEEHDMSGDNLESAAEPVGVIPYVGAWDREAGGMERLMAEVDQIADRIAKAVEANSKHEIGGGQDVAGKVKAAVEALQAAGEAIDQHADALHQAWDQAIEAIRGHQAESAQELAGTH